MDPIAATRGCHTRSPTRAGSTWLRRRVSSRRGSWAPYRVATSAACTPPSLSLPSPGNLIERVVDRVERIQGDHKPCAHEGQPYRHRVDDESQCETWEHRSGAGPLHFGPEEVWMRERPGHQALEGNRHHRHDHR